jgi:hypothetical protein
VETPIIRVVVLAVLPPIDPVLKPRGHRTPPPAEPLDS